MSTTQYNIIDDRSYVVTVNSKLIGAKVVLPMSAAAGASPALQRSSVQLYLDCLRLAKHIGGKSAKANAIRQTIRGQFEKNRNVTDEVELANLKAGAIRGLSNYLVYASSGNDERIKAAMKKASEETAVQNAEWNEVKKENTGSDNN